MISKSKIFLFIKTLELSGFNFKEPKKKKEKDTINFPKHRDIEKEEGD